MGHRCSLKVLEVPPSSVIGTFEGRPVVIDVLRATTTIVTALYNGASRIKPVASLSEALEQRTPEALLAGERDGVPPQGFDLGNSPLEFSPEVVGHREIWLTTTNGTLALERVKGPSMPICLAFSNLSLAAGYLLDEKRDVLVVCSGSRGARSPEDSFLAGALVERLQGGFDLSESAREVLSQYRSHRGGVLEFLRSTPHGGRLRELGFGRDLEYCADIDRCPVIPRMESDGFLYPG